MGLAFVPRLDEESADDKIRWRGGWRCDGCRRLGCSGRDGYGADAGDWLADGLCNGMREGALRGNSGGDGRD